MILNDSEIKELCDTQTDSDLIYPFIDGKIREYNYRPVLSLGLSHFGYDIRLSSKEFKIFNRVPNKLVDPKNFDSDNLVNAKLYENEFEGYFIIPPNSYALGVSVEHFSIPNNITGVAIGKSTYARCGIIVNVTPLEAGWKGYLTIEISNSCSNDVKIYPNEGILQLLFLRGDTCNTSYNDGKYQNQSYNITLAKM
jgi:dCTP deaminase